jgi:hypothetical protein
MLVLYFCACVVPSGTLDTPNSANEQFYLWWSKANIKEEDIDVLLCLIL